MKKKFKLQKNEIEKLQTLFYNKNGLKELINLIIKEESRNDESFSILINEYGKSSFDYNEYGLELCKKYLNDYSLDIKGWDCNFNNFILEINY